MQKSLRSTSIITVTGFFNKDESVTQDFPIPHDVGAPVASLIGHVFKIVQQLGGLMIDGPDNSSADFYPTVSFQKIHIGLKRIQLVGAAH